jgi:ABC-type transporter Mla maintaining outer membrane lipid asymmetry permease subunit MlaE
MKVSEEIDALRAMGSTVRWLVVPRCLALIMPFRS